MSPAWAKQQDRAGTATRPHRAHWSHVLPHTGGLPVAPAQWGSWKPADVGLGEELSPQREGDKWPHGASGSHPRCQAGRAHVGPGPWRGGWGEIAVTGAGEGLLSSGDTQGAVPPSAATSAGPSGHRSPGVATPPTGFFPQGCICTDTTAANCGLCGLLPPGATVTPSPKGR